MAKIALENLISRSPEVKAGSSFDLSNQATRINRLKTEGSGVAPAAIKKERLSPEDAENLLHELLSGNKAQDALASQGMGLSEKRVQELLADDD